MWLSIKAQKNTEHLEDIIFISSKLDEISKSKMHEKMHNKTGLQENKKKNQWRKKRGQKGKDISSNNIKWGQKYYLCLWRLQPLSDLIKRSAYHKIKNKEQVHSKPEKASQISDSISARKSLLSEN